MASISTSFVTGGYYHVYNHAISECDICVSGREYRRFLMALWFYLPVKPQIKLSAYLSLKSLAQQEMLVDINSRSRLVAVHAYSVMPNHYHLLLEQLVENGISTYISRLQNSYSKYYNLRWERHGSLFLSPFKAKRIYSEELCIHVFRYISLNRFSSGLLKFVEQVKTDNYSSIPIYLSPAAQDRHIVSTNMLMGIFKTKDMLWQFVSDYADYQKHLEEVKHFNNFHPAGGGGRARINPI